MWGNPANKSFKQRYIRTVKAGGANVLVHKEVSDLVAAILRSAAAEHGDLEGTRIRGWRPLKEGDEPLLVNYGLVLSGGDRQLDGHTKRWGFSYNPVYMRYEFEGTPADADALSQEAETERMAKLPNAVVNNVWYNGGPGSRVIQLGDMGDDVMCFQLAVDCPTQSGHFDEKTAEYAKTLNSRYGIPHDEDTISEDTWRGLLRLRGLLSRGDVGATVRVLQAALVAYDWQHDLRITGHFDRPTDAAVRGLQQTLGLRESGIVRQPEWFALLQKSLESNL